MNDNTDILNAEKLAEIEADHRGSLQYLLDIERDAPRPIAYIGLLLAHAKALGAEIERLTKRPGRADNLKCCKPCGTARQGDTCWKCGSTLFDAHPDWEEPELPPVEPIRVAAREVGYAIGVHGSQERDLDLIAAPWTDDAIPALDLLKHIAARINARIVTTEAKPGRACAATLQVDGWFKLIDISVCSSVCRRPHDYQSVATIEHLTARATAAEAKVVALTEALERIATDFIPVNQSQQGLALEEIRECAREAVSAALGAKP